MSGNTGTGTPGQEPGGTATGGQPGQEPGGQQNPPAGGQEPQGGQAGDGNPGAIDLNAITDPTIRSYVERQIKDAEEARKEAARYRTERNQFQSQAQQFQQANETAEQRAQREQQERDEQFQRLQQENRDLKAGTAVKTLADNAKAFNPDTVYGLIKGRLQYGEDGMPTNADTLIQELRQSDPYLFKRANADAGEGQGGEGNPAPSMNDAIRAAAGRTRVTLGRSQ